jgi:hypothetical protein
VPDGPRHNARGARAKTRLPIRSQLELDAYATGDVKITASGDDRASISNKAVTVEVRRVGRTFDFTVERRDRGRSERRITRALPAAIVGSVIDAALNCPPRSTDLPPEPAAPD